MVRHLPQLLLLFTLTRCCASQATWTCSVVQLLFYHHPECTFQYVELSTLLEKGIITANADVAMPADKKRLRQHAEALYMMNKYKVDIPLYTCKFARERSLILRTCYMTKQLRAGMSDAEGWYRTWKPPGSQVIVALLPSYTSDFEPLGSSISSSIGKAGLKKAKASLKSVYVE